MISHIFGEISQSGEGYVIIDVAGIGYLVNVPRSISQELEDKKEKIKLHTYLHVREDALILYGFLEPGQLEMFKLLISVTRVGPAIAMNILSRIKLEELASAIIHEDEKVLTRISGVGAKNARRLILELKDKMKKKMEGVTLPASSVNYDAVSALVSLGFPRQDAQRAVEAVSVSGGSVEAIIKAALLKIRE
jgi:Holliday junction DNA helicase RuvA subunit